MSPARIPVIGIVGGIGSGKSTIAQALCQLFDGVRLDADRAGHLALTQPQIQSQLVQAFGTEILDPHGHISRSALAGLVFGNSPPQQAARRQLESIVHPEIRAQLLTQLENHQHLADCHLILLDAALLLEAGWDQLCNAVIFLDVPRDQRLARVQRRGWSAADLQRREESQLALDEKRQQSDFIANNAGNSEVTVQKIAEWLQSRFPNLPRSVA